MAKSLIMIFFSISLAVGGQLLLKTGMNAIGPITGEEVRNGASTIVKVAANPQVVIGLMLYFVSAAIWLVVLSRVDLSFAYPLLGSSYIVVLIASRFLFNEPVTMVRLSGTLLISLGVILISRS